MTNSAPANKSEDTALTRILAWSESRPLWQRDALRRIVKDGFPGDAEIDEILSLCKKEHGDDTINAIAVPLGREHLPVDPGVGESISLKSIANTVGVNQLASDQTLELEPNGISIVYGQNGTGKSGYTRILKRACRSRHAGEIIPDVYSPSSTGNAKASLQIMRANGVAEPIEWEDDGASSEALSAITVFDRQAASVHIQKKNEVWFRPFGLDIPDDLAGVCQEIRTRLEREKSTLEARQNAVFATPPWSGRSSFGKALSALKAETKLDEIAPKAPFTNDDDARLTKLQADLAQDPAVAAQTQRRYAQQLEQISEYLGRVEQSLSKEAIDQVFNAKSLAIDTRAAADLAAREAFSGLAIDGIGESVWRQLWESARAYTASITARGISFPPAEGDVCVLCHQDIDADTAARMHGFEAFVQKDSETKAANAEQEWRDIESGLVSSAPHIRKVSVQYQNLKANNPVLARQVIRHIATARLVHLRMLSALAARPLEQRPSFADEMSGKMRAEAINARAYADTLASDADAPEREAIRNELADLQDRKRKEEFLAIAAQEIDRLIKLKRVEKCIRDTSTTAITRLGNEIADELITPRMRDRFQAEIVELAGSRVRVEVVRSGGKFGSPQYEVRLYANPNARVHDVLSEGEQTCVALASYLTELANATHSSALVFDDPVSSLDHRWRSKVAKRLVKEAAARQIIVFTHDIVFVNDIVQLASEKNTPIALAHLNRGPGSVGIVSPNLPWTASSIRDRIDKLEKAAREAGKRFDAHDDEGYRQSVGSVYSQLRATWERALEDLVFANVVVRHRDYIDTKRLKQVTALEESDIEGFQTNYKRCCDFVDAHDPSRARDAEPPDPQELLNDIEALKTWSEALRVKMNAIR